MEGRRVLQSAGALIRPVPVDDQGLDPETLTAGDAAVYTTRPTSTRSAGLRDHAPGLRITGVDAGLHLVADLPAGTEETEVQRSLGRAGLAVDVLGQYSVAPLARRALVCGYALLPETQAAVAADVIAARVHE